MPGSGRSQCRRPGRPPDALAVLRVAHQGRQSLVRSARPGELRLVANAIPRGRNRAVWPPSRSEQYFRAQLTPDLDDDVRGKTRAPGGLPDRIPAFRLVQAVSLAFVRRQE